MVVVETKQLTSVGMWFMPESIAIGLQQLSPTSKTMFISLSDPELFNKIIDICTGKIDLKLR